MDQTAMPQVGSMMQSKPAIKRLGNKVSIRDTMVEATPEPAPTTAAVPLLASELGQPVTTTSQEIPIQASTTEGEAAPAVTITAESPTKSVVRATDPLHPPSESTTTAHPSSATEPPTASVEEVVPQTIVPTSPPTAMAETGTQPNPPLAGTVEKQLAETFETEPNIDEPENALTNKFTDAEWKALKEFRSQLPDIFADAYPDKPKAREIPVTMWGVSLDPLNPKQDARISVVLMKFLRARNLSIREAREMLVNTLRWREEFNIRKILEEDFPTEVFGHLGHLFGRDKEARPVVYNVYGGDTKAAFEDVPRFLRWRVALMEKSMALLDFNEVDQQIQIHDYAGVSMTSRDSNSKAAASEATNIFQSHYPELLYKKFFVNVPTLLTWIFWAFKPLISAKTLAKMTLVGSGRSSIRKALLTYIDENEIPDKYGGAAVNAF